MKTKLEQENQEILSKKVEQFYCDLKRSSTEYEKEKNKKIVQIREKFIA